MKKLPILVLLLCVVSFHSLQSKDLPGNYYQLKVYHLKNKDQETRLDNFMKNAYVPALHRAGIKQVGIFRLTDTDTLNRRMYLFIPFSKFEEIEQVTAKLQADKQYAESGKDFLQTPFNNPAYIRIESILLRAFPGMPAPALPKLTAAKNDRVYELRSYESASEKYGAAKIRQFNYGSENGTELSIFTRLDFNPVFYGEVLFGGRMPNLMYMTSFQNKTDREEHWKAFNSDPEWVKLKALPEYQNTVSKNTITFLTPTDYSDF